MAAQLVVTVATVGAVSPVVTVALVGGPYYPAVASTFPFPGAATFPSSTTFP